MGRYGEIPHSILYLQDLLLGLEVVRAFGIERMGTASDLDMTPYGSG